MIEPEALCARSLRTFLLRTLAAKLAVLNALRAPVLLAPLAGPYTVPALAYLQLRTGAGTQRIGLTAGVRTAAQVASDLGVGGFAGGSADARGRLVLTGSAPSSSSAALGLDSETEALSATGTHGVFGWDAGGNLVVRTPLAAPTYRNVYDGLPVTADFAGGGVVNVVIADRRSRPSGNIRRQMWDVELDVILYRAEPLASVHASREGIQSALAALRELLVEDRKLDEADSSPSSVMLAQEVSAEISGSPVVFDATNYLFDRAKVTLAVRVYATAGG